MCVFGVSHLGHQTSKTFPLHCPSPEQCDEAGKLAEEVKVRARPEAGGDGGDGVGDELAGDLVRVGRREAGLGAQPAPEHLPADRQQARHEAVRLEEGAHPGARAPEGSRALDHPPLFELQASGLSFQLSCQTLKNTFLTITKVWFLAFAINQLLKWK